jgi:hypothetical protein
MEGFYDPVKPETLVVVPLFDTVDRVDLVNFVKGLGIRTLLFLFSADPRDGWWAIPTSREVPMAADEWVVDRVRELVVKASQDR